MIRTLNGDIPTCHGQIPRVSCRHARSPSCIFRNATGGLYTIDKTHDRSAQQRILDAKRSNANRHKHGHNRLAQAACDAALATQPGAH